MDELYESFDVYWHAAHGTEIETEKGSGLNFDLEDDPMRGGAREYM